MSKKIAVGNDIFSDISFEERLKELEEIQAENDKAKKKERSSPFDSFVQLNKKHTKEIIWLANKNLLAFNIFMFLVGKMDKYNSVVCSYKFLTEIFNCSQSTVTRAVRVLRENNFLRIYKTGGANVYTLNSEIVWNSWGTNVKYCEFTSKVLLCEAEQEQLDKMFDKKEAEDIEDKQVSDEGQV